MSTNGGTPLIRWSTLTAISQLGQWLAYHVLGGLMPLWGTIIYVKVFASSEGSGTPHTWSELIAGGELFLFAAALVTGAFYHLHKDSGWRYPMHAWFTVFGVLLLLVSSLIFAMNMAVTHVQADESIPEITPQGLIWLSLIVYFLAVLMAGLIEWIQVKRDTYRPQQLEVQQIDDFADRVRRLRGSKQ